MPASTSQAPQAAQACPLEPQERVGGEQAARCLYTSWLTRDRSLAGVYASAEAVKYLFGMDPDPNWQWQGCGEITGSPGENACQWLAPPDPGVTFLMVLGGSPALGNTVLSVQASD
ncbi:MAG: hypothetical protein HHJ10_01180 [Cellulomonas sp.]|uniref:hypothetical protein n=1 Tax=Cellulomonas sp. TaxID=40001 RepID=UPI0018210BE8|nr:hypothetical protein [Cellulomonas sp.]NMM29682.1 hypothetical protein [Cellulomonas sp.]